MKGSLYLKNKVIVITGGNSGIGYAAANRSIKEGATVILVGRDKAGITAAVRELGRQAIPYTLNVGSISEISLFYTFVAERFGIVHGVVSNAGIVGLSACEKITEAAYDEEMSINLKGAFFVAQKAVPLMRQGGSIVFNASMAAYKPFSEGAVYAATKAALVSFAKSMGLELANKNIRVNSVSPGNITTPIFDKIGLSKEQKEAFFNGFKNKVPLKRSGAPEEVANVINFLLSDESSYINATDIIVDGGFLVSP